MCNTSTERCSRELGWWLIIALWLLPRWTRWFFTNMGQRVSNPQIKFVILFALGGLANATKSEAVLPAYLSAWCRH
jgi:hypothetical protein